MFAQQYGKLFVMKGSESNTTEYFQSDVRTIVKPYRSTLNYVFLAIWIPYTVYIITGTWTLNLTEQFVSLYTLSCLAWAQCKKRHKLV